MSLISLDVSLIVPGSQKFTYEEGNFVNPLRLKRGEEGIVDFVVTGEKYQSAYVLLVSENISLYQNHESPFSQIIIDSESALKKSALWMEGRSSSLRSIAEQMKAKILFNMYIDSNQMELNIPIEFIKSCYLCGISMELITNS